MGRNTSLSSVGRAPDCSCVKTNVSADIRVSPVQVWERGPTTSDQFRHCSPRNREVGRLFRSGLDARSRARILLVFCSLMVAELSIEEGLVGWMKRGIIFPNLFPKELDHTEFHSKLHHDVVSSLVAGIAHWDTIRLYSILDVLPSHTERNDVLNCNAVWKLKVTRSHTNIACWAVLPDPRLSDTLHPYTLTRLPSNRVLAVTVFLREGFSSHGLEISNIGQILEKVIGVLAYHLKRRNKRIFDWNPIFGDFNRQP